MSDKFQVHFTRAPEKENPITPASLWRMFWGYLKKVFWYAKAQIVKRRQSYRSMFVVSIVMLSFVFTNLILNEARTMGAISSSYGGTHHVMFYGIDLLQAKGAADHKGVKDSFIFPVIATMESSVDSSTVGKVVVLTEEIQKHMQLGITHGTLPGDNEIIVPRGIYSRHGFLILGKEQDMYFQSDEFIYRPMSLGGLYNSTDRNTPYVFVNEKTGAEIRKACGDHVTYDVYLTIKIESDLNAAKIAKEIIKANKIPDTWEQSVNEDASTERNMYKDYINAGAASYRMRHELEFNRLASMGAVVIAALIMASFMTNYTERHISEYGVLAAYGAKRRHLFGVIIGQVLFVTVLSIIPVLIISMGVAWIYTEQYNLARLESNLPVIMSIPQENLVSFAIWYVIILCFICSLTMKRMLSQFPFPMVRGSTAAKIPFVKSSSKRIEKARDKIGHIAFLQSMRLVKRNILPSLATSVICIVCAAFIGYNLINVILYGDRAEDYSQKTFDGHIGATQIAGYEDGFWRGYIPKEDVEYLASLDGVKAVGGIRSGASVDSSGSVTFYNDVEILVEEAKASVTGSSKEELYWHTEVINNAFYSSFTPRYCDESLLPILVDKVLDGDIEKLYTEANTLIFVDNTWADDDAHYHAGDTVMLRTDEDAEAIEMTVAAIVSGTYVKDLNLAMVNGDVIMSPETGEMLDGFPSNLRRGAYFMVEDDLSTEEYQALCEEIGNNVRMIRYDIEFYETSRLKATKMAHLENSMTAVFFAMLYISLCVLDYYHSSESILSQRREFCTLRQMGASNKALYKTTRTSVYAGQVLSIVITVILAIIGILIVNGYCANLSNMYRMNFEANPKVLMEMLDMVNDMQDTYMGMIGALLALTVPLHGLAFLTAIAGTILPTKRILKENIAETLKGSAEI